MKSRWFEQKTWKCDEPLVWASYSFHSGAIGLDDRGPLLTFIWPISIYFSLRTEEYSTGRVGGEKRENQLIFFLELLRTVTFLSWTIVDLLGWKWIFTSIKLSWKVDRHKETCNLLWTSRFFVDIRWFYLNFFDISTIFLIFPPFSWFFFRFFLI